MADVLVTMASSTDKRVVYFSRLKAIACLAVVVLHTFYAADAFAGTLDRHMLALSVRNLMMWAVPCFVMVTGALLLNPKHEVTINKIFRKYLPRVIIALVFYSIAFAIFDAVLLKKPMGEAFTTGLKAIVYGTGWKHMWYLYLMIAIYLVLPFFRMAVRSATDTEIRYTLGVLFVFQSIVPMIPIIWNVEMPFYILFFSIYPVFLLGGYAIHNDIIKIKNWISVLMVVVGVALIVLLTYLGIYKGNVAATSMVGFYSFPGTVLMSVGVFSLFKSFEGKKKPIDTLMVIVDKNSFGIYLLHMAVLKVFALKVRPDIFGKPYWILVEVVLSFVIPFVLMIIYSFIAKNVKKLVKAS